MFGRKKKEDQKIDVNCNGSKEGYAESSAVPTVDVQASSSATVERGKWSGKLDFIFGCINYAVGLGNVWRFPYLCYENGGGAFLVPYIICLILTAIPTFFLEVALGQYFSKGGIGVWNIVPLCKGVGIASIVIVFLSNVYYIIVVSWILFYLVNSFTTELPWKHCNNWWNTEYCWEANSTDVRNASAVTPIQEFWERRALQITDGLHDIGSLRWELAGFLLLAWIGVYFVTWKGIHQSGKIIWVTALFPYVIITTLIVRGVTLPGASKGLYFYVAPKWEKLLQPQVWIAAGTQVFYTFGVGFGSVIALGSYNKFHHNFFRDSLILCVVNPCTSILAGTVIFSVLGHMSYLTYKEVGDVVKSGPGLAFLAYPEVVAKMPGAPIWSVLFFSMLLILGLDSQFCTAEALVAGFVDVWPRLLNHRKKVTLVFCAVQFLLGLPMVTKGGMYLFQLVDNYAVSGMTLLFIVFFQVITVSWIYGARKFSDHIEEMIGRRPNIFFKISWLFVVPLICMVIFLSSVIKYQPPVYAKTYVYPWWGQMIGWFMGLISMMMVPGYMVYYLMKTPGTFGEKLLKGITSTMPEKKVMPEESVLLEQVSSSTKPE